MKRQLYYFILISYIIVLLSGCSIKSAFCLQGPSEKVARTEDITILSMQGKIVVRVYTPYGKGPFPILVYNHGGGWISGSIDKNDTICRYFANMVNCVVVSVNYRLAPKYKFPIPVEDAYAATMWAFKNANSINGDSTRIAIGGESAGGNLSAAVCLMARDRGGPPIVFQLLVIPVTNLSSLDTESYRNHAKGQGLTKTDVKIVRGLYLRNVNDRFNPYASPFLAKDLNKLPPVLVITGEYDVLRDEGEAYTERLKQAGVPARFYRCKGMGHLGVYWTTASALVKAPLDEAVSALHKAFSK